MKPSPGGLAATGIIFGDEQRFSWLRLSRSEGIGPHTFKALINRFGGAAAALEALPELARQRGKANIRIPGRDEIEREFTTARRLGARFVALGEPDYPALLRVLDGAPPIVAIAGSLSVFAKPMVAIVGSRNASGAGRTFTERLARDLTQAGFAIASGLARGIDTKAHEASLEFGTVAVLAGGLDKPYPPENLPLFHKIVEHGGAIISEMPFGCEPRGRDFPRRNRIISGLSYATVIIEAARKSGSLITARFANEQGREVFAVPGSPMDPRAEGTNDLLRDGATICTGAEDIVRVLQPMISEPDMFARNISGSEESISTYGGEPLWDELLSGDGDVPEAHLPVEFEEEQGAMDYSGARDEAESRAPGNAVERVLAVLGPTPIELDDIARLANVPLREVHSVLLDLDMAGKIERHGANRISLA